MDTKLFLFSAGFYEFYTDTGLFSLTKRKWFQGPKFPPAIGIEEGCATLLDRYTVMIFGMTKLFGKLWRFFSKFHVHVINVRFFFSLEENHGYVRTIVDYWTQKISTVLISHLDQGPNLV